MLIDRVNRVPGVLEDEREPQEEMVRMEMTVSPGLLVILDPRWEHCVVNV